LKIVRQCTHSHGSVKVTVYSAVGNAAFAARAGVKVADDALRAACNPTKIITNHDI
jgi:hypothetical protein